MAQKYFDKRYLKGIVDIKRGNRMSLPQTEASSDQLAIDSVAPDAAVSLMLDGQVAAVGAVRKATPELTRAAALMAGVIRAGGRLIYCAAGSSGLMALADASELCGTFGIPSDQVQIHMAGGVPIHADMPGDTEDDTISARAIRFSSSDAAIILSASGSTPYALAAAENARGSGAEIIAIANNPGAALFKDADLSICLQTPPELIAGSTRLGAGTAQKIALNVMSSLMGVQLGHVYQGLMVNVVADNAKLLQRAALIVRQIADVSVEEATTALTAANGRIKPAILIAKGHSASEARALLELHRGHLGPCLQTELQETN